MGKRCPAPNDRPDICPVQHIAPHRGWQHWRAEASAVHRERRADPAPPTHDAKGLLSTCIA